MKKFLLLLTFAVHSLVFMSAEKVEFSRFFYEDGGYLFSTFMTSHQTPFAVLKDGKGYSAGDEMTVILLSSELTPEYSFSIKLPSDGVKGTLSFVGQRDRYIQEILVTQHFFNDDDLYEVVVATKAHEYDEASYKIYNEKGEMLGDCPSPVIYELDGKYYLYSEYGHMNSMGENVSELYMPKKCESTISQIKSESTTLSIFPNPAENEDIVVINLPESMSEAKLIKVFALDGRLIYDNVCNIGDLTLRIPAYKFSKGINAIIIVDKEGNVLASGKIIRK